MPRPRNWHAVAAHHRNSAGPMGKRPDRGPSADEWEDEEPMTLTELWKKEAERWAARNYDLIDWATYDRWNEGEWSDGDIGQLSDMGLLTIDWSEPAWDGGLCWSRNVQRCDAIDSMRESANPNDS